MTGPLKLIMKSATEYRVGSPEGEVRTAEVTTVLPLVALTEGHAVCVKNGRPIFIASSGVRARPR
jgi:hypothetical protein